MCLSFLSGGFWQFCDLMRPNVNFPIQLWRRPSRLLDWFLLAKYEIISPLSAALLDCHKVESPTCRVSFGATILVSESSHLSGFCYQTSINDWG